MLVPAGIATEAFTPSLNGNVTPPAGQTGAGKVRRVGLDLERIGLTTRRAVVAGDHEVVGAEFEERDLVDPFDRGSTTRGPGDDAQACRRLILTGVGQRRRGVPAGDTQLAVADRLETRPLLAVSEVVLGPMTVRS